MPELLTHESYSKGSPDSSLYCYKGFSRPKFLASMAKGFPHIYVWGFRFYFAQRAAPRPCRAASLFNNQPQSKSKSLCQHGFIKLSNINLFISTCRDQSVYVNMSIPTCLYQIVCLNHLFCHSFDITSSASLLLPTCVWRGRDSTWWPRQMLVSPATERSARFCVRAMFPCVAGTVFGGSGIHLCRQCPRVLVCGRDSSSRGRRSMGCSGDHLCRRRPRVLVCGRNASLRARRSVMSTSTCLYHICSFNMAISKRLYQHVQINMSK